MSKRYRLGDGSTLTAADQVSLRVDTGASLALVGPSGSGKSTLLHLIGAIDVPDEGSIRIDGVDITDLGRRGLADYRSGIGFVFQQFHLLPALTAIDNVVAPLIGRGSLREGRRRASEMLDAVGLGGRGDARPDQLSGGQQQRVAIARALVAEPSLLLADEPTGNLDSATAADIMVLLAEVQERFDATLIIATHDLDVAEVCDDVALIRDGRSELATESVS